MNPLPPEAQKQVDLSQMNARKQMAAPSAVVPASDSASPMYEPNLQDDPVVLAAANAMATDDGSIPDMSFSHLTPKQLKAAQALADIKRSMAKAFSDISTGEKIGITAPAASADTGPKLPDVGAAIGNWLSGKYNIWNDAGTAAPAPAAPANLPIGGGTATGVGGTMPAPKAPAVPPPPPDVPGQAGDIGDLIAAYGTSGAGSVVPRGKTSDELTRATDYIGKNTRDANFLSSILNGLSSGIDILGAGNKAYAGVESPTRIQREYAMALESQRAANQFAAAAKSEIDKMDPAIQAEIKKLVVEKGLDLRNAIKEMAAKYLYDKALRQLELEIMYQKAATDVPKLSNTENAAADLFGRTR